MWPKQGKKSTPGRRLTGPPRACRDPLWKGQAKVRPMRGFDDGKEPARQRPRVGLVWHVKSYMYPTILRAVAAQVRPKSGPGGLTAHAGLDIVAVRIEDEGPVVIAGTLARPGRAVVAAAGVERGAVEFVHHRLAFRHEGDMH